MNERQWVDANVIVRFLTKDSPELSPRSLELFRRAAEGELVLRVASLVVAEVTWVLGSFYRWSRTEVADGLSGFLAGDGLEVEELDLVLRALQVMSASNVSFVDAYLAESARLAHEPVASFDRSFARLNVEWIEPG